MMATRSKGSTSGGNDNLEDLINKVCLNFSNKLENKIEQKFDKLNENLTELNNSIKAMNKVVTSNQKAIIGLEQKNDYVEQFSKKNTLRFVGFLECTEPNEDAVSLVSTFINDKLNVSCNDMDIDCAFRIGSSGTSDKPRTILVQFVRNVKRNEVYKAKRLLKNTEISIFEDLTKTRFNLLQLARKKYGKQKAWTSGGKIFVWSDRDNKKRLINEETDL